MRQSRHQLKDVIAPGSDQSREFKPFFPRQSAQQHRYTNPEHS